jgi:hypothetical protein
MKGISDISILQYRNIACSQLKQPNIFTKVSSVTIKFFQTPIHPQKKTTPKHGRVIINLII